jgi:predicted acetyltransferase
LTVPGCTQIRASAISAVTVLPTHRRRGLLSRLVAAEHEAARERGEPVAMLFPTEFPIYGRFGYGPATLVATWSVKVRTTAFVPGPADAGQVELVPADEKTLDAARDLYERWRLRRPGEIWRRPLTWQDDFGLTDDIWGNRWKGFIAFHRDAAGTLDGYVRFKAEEHWEDRQPSYTLVVNDLLGLREDVEASLWRFLGGFDFAETIRAERRSPADRLPWLLTNQRAAVAESIGDGLWVKILDVPAALEARRYERSGSIVLEIVDADGRDADGEVVERRSRILLDASPDGATAAPTDRSADLTIGAGALGAAYLGGTRLSRAALAAGYDEHRPGSLGEAEALLATFEEPRCSSHF